MPKHIKRHGKERSKLEYSNNDAGSGSTSRRSCEAPNVSYYNGLSSLFAMGRQPVDGRLVDAAVAAHSVCNSNIHVMQMQ